MKRVFVFLILTIYANASIILAAAANTQYAVDKIIDIFKSKYNINVRKVISSSGKLTSQITHGAPYDIFLSANMKYPLFLYKKGFVVNKPKVYAKGVLVIWTLKNFNLKNWEESLKKAKKIALPNPKNAPYGKAAVTVLKKKGIFKDIKEKIVYGESVSQTNQYIVSKIADIGFTAKSVVLSPKMKNLGKYKDIDKNLYNPIAQGVVITKYGYKNHKDEVLKFYNFLFSKKAKEIFKKYGYVTRNEKQNGGVLE